MSKGITRAVWALAAPHQVQEKQNKTNKRERDLRDTDRYSLRNLNMGYFMIKQVYWYSLGVVMAL